MRHRMIQNEYAKKAYDTWVAEASKLGEMYAAIARDAYNQGTKKVRPREGRSLLDPCNYQSVECGGGGD